MTRYSGMVAVALVCLSTLASTPALAACKEGFCTSGNDGVGPYTGAPTGHYVSFTSSYNNVTHFNVDMPWYGQQEVGRNVRSFWYPCGNGESTAYSIQACTRGGLLQKSACGPWVRFTHTCRF